jgi:hypothetical protein
MSMPLAERTTRPWWINHGGAPPRLVTSSTSTERDLCFRWIRKKTDHSHMFHGNPVLIFVAFLRSDARDVSWSCAIPFLPFVERGYWASQIRYISFGVLLPGARPSGPVDCILSLSTFSRKRTMLQVELADPPCRLLTQSIVGGYMAWLTW